MVTKNTSRWSIVNSGLFRLTHRLCMVTIMPVTQSSQTKRTWFMLGNTKQHLKMRRTDGDFSTSPTSPQHGNRSLELQASVTGFLHANGCIRMDAQGQICGANGVWSEAQAETSFITSNGSPRLHHLQEERGGEHTAVGDEEVEDDDDDDDDDDDKDVRGACMDLPSPISQSFPKSDESLATPGSDQRVGDEIEEPVDIGFMAASLFLVTGIILVVVAYSVPREPTVNPEEVSARQMESIENSYARLGEHLDKCIIAGLCFLTLGGVTLSCLMLIALCKGDIYHAHRMGVTWPARTYGSLNLRLDSPDSDKHRTFIEMDVLQD
uniref:Transmembrane protein 74 n=1 Tax=Eptatretus burgeri TaxID=7764 RepID=A0A8C4Q601_EPTBU